VECVREGGGERDLNSKCKSIHRLNSNSDIPGLTASSDQRRFSEVEVESWKLEGQKTWDTKSRKVRHNNRERSGRVCKES
jgi:hypothetical protein